MNDQAPLATAPCRTNLADVTHVGCALLTSAEAT